MIHSKLIYEVMCSSVISSLHLLTYPPFSPPYNFHLPITSIVDYGTKNKPLERIPRWLCLPINRLLRSFSFLLQIIVYHFWKHRYSLYIEGERQN